MKRTSRCRSFLTVLLATSSIALAQQFGEKQEKATSIGRIGLTVTNNGIIGNSFKGPFLAGAPSCEFPIGSGIEHLFDGGLWIGGIVRGEPLVSTGAAGDDANGYDPGNAGYEFTYASALAERSSLFNAQFYSPLAVSHQDFVANFTDSLTIIPGSTVAIDQHTKPLKATVRLESYAWNFSFADFFVILNYSITNRSGDPWDNVYLGMWADFVVRNVKITAPRGTDFFSHGANGILDSMDLIYTYNFDADGNFADNYAGMAILGGDWRGQLLTSRAFPHWPDSLRSLYTGADTSGPRARYQFWGFRSTELETGSPRNDAERYGKMSNSINRDLVDAPGGMRTSPGNRLSMISFGPIPRIAPGETVNFVMAVVTAPFGEPRPAGGITLAVEERLRKGIAENLAWAVRAYNGEDKNGNGVLDPGEDNNLNGVIDRYRLPEPPSPPASRAVPGDRKVTLYWDRRAEHSVDPITNVRDFEGYKIYRTNPGSDLTLGQDLTLTLQLIAEFDSAGNDIGINNGFESRGNFEQLSSPVFFPGDTTPYAYKYEVDGLLNGWQYVFSVTAYDRGDADQGLLPLESSRFQSAIRVIPGTPANEGFVRGGVSVYPNPYYVRAGWDGTAERDRKLYFTNLPADCDIHIYTLAGETVDILHHRSTYQGEDVRWFTTFGGRNSVLAGGEHAWDLISRADQRLATGLYLFAVKDNLTGDIERGKFVIVR